MNAQTTHSRESILPVQKCIGGEDVKKLSDIELLAIVLNTGIKNNNVLGLSTDILSEFSGLTGLFKTGVRELSKKKGIGLKKAIRIHASLEMGRRIIGSRVCMPRIDSPGLVWELLLNEMAGLNREEFRVLILNNKNHLLKKNLVSVGTVSESIVHPREVFRDAIREGGSGIIMAHNHPSGVTTPSREDIQTTSRIAECGKIIGIPLMDHVIITDTSYLSMREEGYVPI